jgi:para-aminobenzoate synthetase component 1
MNLTIKNCHIKEIDFNEPADLFGQYADFYYSFILTGHGLQDISQFSYIGIFPHTIIRYDRGLFEIETEGGIEKQEGPFWSYLNSIHNATNFESLSFPAKMCGGIGYLSYEGSHTIEEIASLTRESYTMPIMELVFFNHYIFFDHPRGKAYYIEMNYEEPSQIKKWIPADCSGVSVTGIEAECTEKEYMKKVSRIIEYILEGDVYEVCLTQQFSADFRGNPYDLFRLVFRENPAPFSAYLNCRDISIVCNSPELFIRCFDRRVETRPIKGTAPRGKTEKEDKRNRDSLLSSEKDQAELYMIIDLLRNDIGKVCKTGSVKVADAKRIEAYESVYQLIGVVEGELDQGKTYIDLLKATFPGGSITGCPKIRSMEIIEELETYKRNIYTGTLFIFNREYFISNIVIRTAVVQGDRVFLNSGGAVTLDSDPRSEHQEIMHKMRNFMRVMESEDSL